MELWPLEYPGHESRFRDAAFDDAAPLAAAIAAEVASVIDLPFALFGHSMGALLAFETARRLRAQYQLQPLTLFVSGYGSPHLPLFRPPVRNLPEDKFREELRFYGGTPDEVLADNDLMQLLSPLLRRDLSVCETYTYSTEPKLNFPIVAFGGAEDPTVPWNRLFEWSHQTLASFRAYVMRGEHFFVRRAGPLICKIIAQHLEQGDSLSRTMAPAAEEVHLWQVNLEVPEETLARLRPVLSPSELQRADAFLQAADRARYTITRAALRTLLGRYGNLPAKDIELSYSSHGKPRCQKLLPVDFNVAHSGSLALIAISRGQAIGVDVERIRTGIEFQAIGKQVFTPSELRELAQRAPDQQMNAFFDLWARKEAFLKCRGDGLMGSPEKIHLGLPPFTQPLPSEIGQDYTTGPSRLVQSFTPAPGYTGAVAVEKDWEQVTFRTWQSDGVDLTSTAKDVRDGPPPTAGGSV